MKSAEVLVAATEEERVVPLEAAVGFAKTDEERVERLELLELLEPLEPFVCFPAREEERSELFRAVVGVASAIQTVVVWVRSAHVGLAFFLGEGVTELFDAQSPKPGIQPSPQ
jgi:hypothetical protein